MQRADGNKPRETAPPAEQQPGVPEQHDAHVRAWRAWLERIKQHPAAE